MTVVDLTPPTPKVMRAALEVYREAHRAGFSNEATVEVGKWLVRVVEVGGIFSSSFEQIRARFWRELEEGEPLTCPCCDQTARIYRRKLNSGMAHVLIRILRATQGHGDGWVHITDIFGGTSQDHRDWPVMRHWGLIEPRERRTKDENPRGYWRLTNLGDDFVRGRCAVPRHIFLYSNEPRGESPEKTTIEEALGDQFDYRELMRGL